MVNSKSTYKNGNTLSELVRELQTDLYHPILKANFRIIIYTRRKKSHMQVTERAHDYHDVTRYII